MASQNMFHDLYYHLVFVTKEREPCIRGPDEHRLLEAALDAKVNQLGAILLGFGTWLDHGHLLLRSKPSLAVSVLCGQLKGFSSRVWNLKHPEIRLEWCRGYYAATVNPTDHQGLLRYIRRQREHHMERMSIDRWEPGELLAMARTSASAQRSATELLAVAPS